MVDSGGAVVEARVGELLAQQDDLVLELEGDLVWGAMRRLRTGSEPGLALGSVAGDELGHPGFGDAVGGVSWRLCKCVI